MGPGFCSPQRIVSLSLFSIKKSKMIEFKDFWIGVKDILILLASPKPVLLYEKDRLRNLSHQYHWMVMSEPIIRPLVSPESRQCLLDLPIKLRDSFLESMEHKILWQLSQSADDDRIHRLRLIPMMINYDAD